MLRGAYVAGNERMEPKSCPGVLSRKRLVSLFPQSPLAAPGSPSMMFGYIYMSRNTVNSYLMGLPTTEPVENLIWIADISKDCLNYSWDSFPIYATAPTYW